MMPSGKRSKKKRRDKDKNFQKHKRMIYKIAWNWFKEGEEFEEMLSIGYECWVDTYTEFDKERGTKFSTFFWIRANQAVIRYKRKAIREHEKTKALAEYTMTAQLPISDPENLVIFADTIEKLSDDAKSIVRAVLSIDGPHNLKAIRNRFRKKGWQFKRINGAIGELKKSFR
jgi:hypothetical protein